MTDRKKTLMRTTPLSGNAALLGIFPKFFAAFKRARIDISKMRCYMGSAYD
jgi:hypothetical protein